MAERVAPLIQSGLVAICPPIEMELVYGARNTADCDNIHEWCRGFERLFIPDQVWDRAVEIQAILVKQSEHRTVRMPDIVIAATAERHSVKVLHYDRDFDRIAKVTGQRTEWVVPPGEADLPNIANRALRECVDIRQAGREVTPPMADAAGQQAQPGVSASLFRPMVGMPRLTPGSFGLRPDSQASPALVRRWLRISASATRWCGAP